MSKVIDLTGRRFGRLVVTSRDPRRGGLAHWQCKCDCGGSTISSGNNLRGGYSKSCGCGHTKHGQALTKANSAEYTCWRNMRNRCENHNLPTYRHYGARGISVCARWQAFENFFADMGQRPSARHSIERVNNDGSYTPKNCVWATKSQQNKNRRKL